MHTLLDLFHTFASRGESVAMEWRAFRTFRFSYADLARLIRATAQWLEGKGVGRGDRVVIWAPNGPWWVVAYFGVLLKGGVVVPVDFASDTPRARWIGEKAGAKFAFASRYKAGVELGVETVMIEELEGLLGDAHNFFAAELGLPSATVPIQPPVPPNPAVSVLPHTVLAAKIGEPPHGEVGDASHMQISEEGGGERKESDVAVLIYTSGTTGEPKGVPLTHANLAANLAAVRAHIEVRPADVFLSVLPLSHMFEMMGGCLAPLSVGARVAYLRTVKPSAILDAFATGTITVFIAVPRLLAVLKGGIEQTFARLRLGRAFTWLRHGARHLSSRSRKKLFWFIHKKIGPRFRYFVSGGAALDRDTARFWDDLGFTVLEGYGLTECAPVLTANQPEHVRLGTVGRPVEGVTIRIAADGEIEARGPNIFSGYADNPRATAEAFSLDGWLKTGDVGTIDTGGYLTIQSRKKDVIVTTAGMNVYPEDVEASLVRVKGVKECTVIGLDRGQGESVHAVLALEKGCEAAHAVAEANKNLDSLQHITDWTVWEGELPKTTTLKVKKSDVKEIIAKGIARQTSAGGREKADTVKRIIGAVVRRDPAAILDEDRLADDLHVTSLDRADVLHRLELEYRRDLPDSVIGPATTVADLARLTQEKHAAPALHLRMWTYTPRMIRFRAQAQAALIYPLMRFVGAPVAEGTEQFLSLSGPCILAANHVSYFDQSMIFASLPAARSARIATAARSAFFFEETGKTLFIKAWKRFCFEFCTIVLGAFALHQKQHVQESLAFMGRLLDRGISLLIFPEGERTRDGVLLPFQGGLGRMVQEFRVPVVPVRCKNLDKIFPRGSWRIQRGHAVIVFGDPLYFGPGADPAEIVRRVKESIEAL